MFIGIVLLLQLTACGSNTTFQSSQPFSHSTSTPLPTPALTPKLSSSPPEAFFRTPSLFNRPVIGAFDISENLRIYPPNAGCGLNNNATNGVLTTDRLTYDSGEIQQMANYFDAAYSPGGHAPLNLPSTLQYALGFFPGSIAKWGLANEPNKCELDMSITNISNTTIQIDHVSLRIAHDALPNTYQYRLIDACTLPLADKSSICPTGRGAPGGAYIYTYVLGAEKAGTSVESTSFTPGVAVSKDGVLSPGKDGPIILNSGDTASIVLLFQEKTLTSDYIYSITPQLFIDNMNNQQLVDLNQLTGNVAFLDPQKQSMCYQLEGSNFVAIDNNNTPRVSTSVDTSIDKNINCI